MIAITILGIFILSAGALVCYAHHIEITQSESFSGRIVGFLEKNVARKGRSYKVYCPVVRFSMNGILRTAEYHSYKEMLQFRHTKGETVIICVDPRMPESFHFAYEEKHFSIAGISIMVSGGLIMILSIVLDIIYLGGTE